MGARGRTDHAPAPSHFACGNLLALQHAKAELCALRRALLRAVRLEIHCCRRKQRGGPSSARFRAAQSTNFVFSRWRGVATRESGEMPMLDVAETCGPRRRLPRARALGLAALRCSLATLGARLLLYPAASRLKLSRRLTLRELRSARAALSLRAAARSASGRGSRAVAVTWTDEGVEISRHVTRLVHHRQPTAAARSSAARPSGSQCNTKTTSVTAVSLGRALAKTPRRSSGHVRYR
jgi:hypothetical protein